MQSIFIKNKIISLLNKSNRVQKTVIVKEFEEFIQHIKDIERAKVCREFQKEFENSIFKIKR
jgi:hypothetical protein